MIREKEKNQDKEPIVIDISNIDTKSVKKQEYFLQKDGFEKVAELLKKEVTSKKVKKKNSSLQRSHNTIFINGQRGSGKTQFLISIRNYLKKNDKKTLKKLYFIKSIDPTLLHDNESFLTIIIAKILNQLEEENKLNDLEKEEKTEFYKYLSNISLAIDGVIHQHNKDKSSLEHIAQDQTSLRLERYLDEFFHKVTKIVQKRKIVLLIDDIDMAFEKGFEVLEVMRKYLSSLHVIPIVTGDINLYHKILEVHFEKHMKEKIDTEKLALDYLIKVLPTYKRINIKTLYQLSKDKELQFKFKNFEPYKFKCYSCESSNNKDNYFYKQVEEVFPIETFRKVFIKNLFSNPIRNIIQFLHNEHKKENNFSLNTLENIEILEKTYFLILLNEVNSWKSFFQEGKSFFQRNDWEKAIQYFNKSLNLKKTEDVYYYLGNCHYNLSAWEEAERAYTKVINLNEKHSDALFKIGATYRKRGDYSTAERYYLESIKLNSDYDNAYNQLGICYIHLEKISLAIENFKKAIEINPENSKAYINIIEVSFLVNKTYYNSDFEKEFLKKFKDVKNIMKSYEMIQILTKIRNQKEEKNIEKEFNLWVDNYRDAKHPDWSFLELEYSIEKEKNIDIKNKLIHYLKKFKEYS